MGSFEKVDYVEKRLFPFDEYREIIMKNRVKLIVCYYGTLPTEFSLWLSSCKNNPDFDFLIVTDTEVFNIPSNVSVLNISIEEVKKRFSTACGLNVILSKPYKLCDFKPLYGKAFTDELKGYDFWGHCDIDVVWGDIKKFITDDILNKYDRIGTYGHFTLYRNCARMNDLYQEKGSAFPYQTVFTSPHNYNFDEMYGMNLICKKKNIAWFNIKHDCFLDKLPGKVLAFHNTPNFRGQTVLWKDGKIYQFYEIEQLENKEEKMYYHFSGMHYTLEKVSDCIWFNAQGCWNTKTSIESSWDGEIDTNKARLTDMRNKYKSYNFTQKYIAIRQRIVKKLLDIRFRK